MIDGFQPPFVLNRVGMGGGVMCYVTNNLAAKRCRNFEIPDTEALWVEICSTSTKFLLCTTYRPPNVNHD